jgi:hypothetical protein
MMKLVTRLLVLGTVFAAGMLVAHRRAARSLHAGPARLDDDLAQIPDADIYEEVVIVGLAGIDPGGLMGFGEPT